MRFTAIPQGQVQHIWPRINGGMDKLFKESLGLMNADDILNNCADGKWLLFCMYEEGEPVVSLVCEIREGDVRIFDVGFCWGTRMEEWINQVYESFETIARQCGCEYIAFKGRPGWRKLAHNFGFSVSSMSYVKALERV